MTVAKRVRLDLARARAAGHPFSVAWERATDPLEPRDRRAVTWAKDAWQRAYERAPKVRVDYLDGMNDVLPPTNERGPKLVA